MTAARSMIQDALLAGIAAANPAVLVESALDAIELPPDQPIRCVAMGKAARGMVDGARRHLGSRLTGVAVDLDGSPIPGFEVLVGGHPIPDQRSFAAGAAVLEFAEACGSHDIVLALISGGGSAMVEAPLPGITTSDIIERTTRLLTSGVAIDEINRERAEMSAIKAGRLLMAAQPSRVITLAMSDVAGAPPATIASGPTVGSEPIIVIGDGTTAAVGVAAHLDRVGFVTTVQEKPVSGSAAATGEALAVRAASLQPGEALVFHGETTVNVRGAGIGGRNQELALAAAGALQRSDLFIGALDTDGIDGVSPNAGAVVSGDTVPLGVAAGLDAASALAQNDSASYLESVGAQITTGPTGTNVGDVGVVARTPA